VRTDHAFAAPVVEHQRQTNVPLVELLGELQRRLQVDVDELLDEADELLTDYGFGWQRRGQQLRRRLSNVHAMIDACELYRDAVS
jgi:hypothetical protein